MSRSEEQRRTMFDKMRTRRFSFPLKGEGGRAQRNRGTLVATGVGAIGTGALLVAAGLTVAPVLAIGGGVGLIGYSLSKAFGKQVGSRGGGKGEET